VEESAYASTDENTLVDMVYSKMVEQYKRKSEKISTKGFPQIKHVYETMSNKYKNIVFPLTDGRREMQLIVNLEEAYNSEGRAISKSLERNVILSTIDNEWKEHLREMDDLRSAVHNASYEQKDPLLVYKLESFDLFKNMINRLNTESVEFLMKLDIPIEQELQSTNKEERQNNYGNSRSNSNSTEPPRFSGSDGYRQAIESSIPQPEKREPVIVETKAGRNDPCPCGSGKKFKQCHGK
jgi:preprotein translocase subunit SecA